LIEKKLTEEEQDFMNIMKGAITVKQNNSFMRKYILAGKIQ